jgi:hypothetical protein
MAAVDLDRQTIERRDFPIGRRGYDPAAVDAHLRALATGVEELQRTAPGRVVDSLAATAGTQVQGIIEAAEAAAAEIESQARANAKNVRDQADEDAEKTRSDAVARAQAHAATVSKATATLLQRVDSLDAEASALVDSLRVGASRLAGDLAKVETNMVELYDAASGREPADADGEPAVVSTDAVGGGAEAGGAKTGGRVLDPSPGPRPAVPTSPVSPSPPAAPLPPPPKSTPPAATRPAVSPSRAAVETPAATNGDLDGARLIALNMALNGESREDVDRYLAENFKLADRQKLIDEVYAAIEG